MCDFFVFRKSIQTLVQCINVVCADESEYVVAIPKAAHELKLRIGEIPHAINPHFMVGAFKGDNEPEDGYWVCVQVEQFSNIPDGMGTVVVPPQKYAVKWHYGHRSEVSKTHHKLDELIREVGHQVQPMKMGVEMFSIIF